MAAEWDRQELPSEETPLVAQSAEENGTGTAVPLLRGLAITSLMGLLIFIQSNSLQS